MNNFVIETRPSKKYARWQFVDLAPNLIEAEIQIRAHAPLSMFENYEWRIKNRNDNLTYVHYARINDYDYY